MARSTALLIRISRAYSLPVALAVAAGIVLRVATYLSVDSLWLDELALAHNVLDRDLVHLLFTPLQYRQAVPAGVLLLVKLATLLFGAGEHALRAPSLLASLAALVAFPIAVAPILRRPAVFLATALFALAPGLIWHAVDAKPYAFDLLASVALLGAFAARGVHGTPTLRVHLTLAAVAASAFLVSYASPFVYAGSLAASFALFLARPSRRTAALKSHAAGAVAFALLAAPIAWLHLRSVAPSDTAFFRFGWSDGFLGYDPAVSPTAFVTSRLGMFAELVLLLPSVWLAFYGVLLVLGTMSLVAGRRAFALTVGPFAVALVASWARWHPFHLRQLLFLSPQLAVMAAGTIDVAARWLRRSPLHGLSRRAAPLVGALALLAPWTASTLADPPPMARQDMKTILRFVADHRQPGDGIFVYYTGAPAMAFYGAGAGITPSEYRVTPCDRAHPWKYIDDLHAYLAGHARVWLVVAQPINREPDLLTSYLDRAGRRIAGRTVRGRDEVFTSSAVLYELDPDPAVQARAYVEAGNRATEWAHPPPSRFLCEGAWAP